MIVYHDRLLELGVRIIGGCCGTTPAHIGAIRRHLPAEISVAVMRSAEA